MSSYVFDMQRQDDVARVERTWRASRANHWVGECRGAGDVGGREVFLIAENRERGLFGGLWLLRRVYELICAGGVLVEPRDCAGIRSRPRSAASFRRAPVRSMG